MLVNLKPRDWSGNTFFPRDCVSALFPGLSASGASLVHPRFDPATSATSNCLTGLWGNILSHRWDLLFNLGRLNDSWNGRRRLLLHWVPPTTMLRLAYQRVWVVDYKTQYEEALLVIKAGKLLKGQLGNTFHLATQFMNIRSDIAGLSFYTSCSRSTELLESTMMGLISTQSDLYNDMLPKRKDPKVSKSKSYPIRCWLPNRFHSSTLLTSKGIK